MSDVVTEKFTQNVINLVEEVTEVNILVRRLDLTKETLNRINERNDAIHTAIVQIEKSLQLDDKRITTLQAQTALLRETLEQQKRQREQFEQTVLALNQAVFSSEAGIKGQVAKIGEELKDRIDAAHNALVMWLLIVGGALLVILAILIFAH
jgi:hypothetical protein